MRQIFLKFTSNFTANLRVLYLRQICEVKSKGSHRTLIKHDSGVVRGYVVESTIFPLKEELFASQQKEFAALGQDIHARRNNIGYDNFDQFKSDSKSVAFVETVFK